MVKKHTKRKLMALCLGHIMTTLCFSQSHGQDWPTMGSPSQHYTSHDHSYHLASRQGPPRRSNKSPFGTSKKNYWLVKNKKYLSDPCPTSCRCKFFLWDFVSFFKYQETSYQAQQNTFEGRGGKKFVRVQSNTVLEKWYPQLREGLLKTDGCFLCGYSWKEHLEYWWHCRRRKGDVSEFDSYLKNSANTGGNAYHKKYVEEVDNNLRGSHRYGQEVRQSFEGDVSFLVPPFDPIADGRKKSIGSMLLLALARIQCLVKIEDLIWLNAVDSLREERNARDN